MAAVTDEIGSAVELVIGKTTGQPLAVVRGLAHLVTADDGPGCRSVQRRSNEDLFRLGTAEAYAEGWKAGYEAALRAPDVAASPAGGNEG